MKQPGSTMNETASGLANVTGFAHLRSWRKRAGSTQSQKHLSENALADNRMDDRSF
jgi:hypothetical protein